MRWLLLLILLSACGGTIQPTARDFYLELQGSWESNCFIQGEGFKIQTLIFNNTKVSLNEKVFSDSGCNNLIYESTAEAFFTLGNNANFILDRSIEIIYYMQDASLTVRDSAMVNQFNSESRCGFFNWSLNSGKIVNGLNCIPNDKIMPIKNRSYLNLIKIENGLLYQGNDRCELDNSCFIIGSQKYPKEFYNFTLQKK